MKKNENPVINNKIERFDPELEFGLSDSQSEQRKLCGLTNIDATVKTKTIGQIFLYHICTLFNLVNIALAILVISVEEYRNSLFVLVVFFNTGIGIFQEIRAKRKVDKLSFITQNNTTVKRNGKTALISRHEIVLDDILIFENGNQICCDCEVREGECEADESFVTGESDPVFKKRGDLLLAGSFIVSGSCVARADRIGNDSYISKISKDAKYIKKDSSELILFSKKIIKLISYIIIPFGAAIFIKQYFFLENITYNLAIVRTTAALVGIIPQGLMLLTSSALALGVIRLVNSRVLVQDIYCIETLARVDTVCLDKTGTITEGSLEICDFVLLNQQNAGDIENIISRFSNSVPDKNATATAIRQHFGSIQNNDKQNDKVTSTYCFSNKTMFSGIYIESRGLYLFGAAERMVSSIPDDIKAKLTSASTKYRIVSIVHSKSNIENGVIPADAVVIGYIALKDKIRKNAAEVINYFYTQDVDIKVISGDNPVTVSGIAKTVGIKNFDKYIDCSALSGDADIYEAAKNYTIFGRVNPDMKKSLIMALKSMGHKVAMTGDGVNDVLALREADCSIAMASGSDAARNVSNLVLLESAFDAIPDIIAEGRRSVNNIQRSSILFLTKSLFTVVFSFLMLFINAPYPFYPIQLTLISIVSIGLPSVILTFSPNKERIKNNFLMNVALKSIPAAMVQLSVILIVIISTWLFGFSSPAITSISVLVLCFASMVILIDVCRPLNLVRSALITVMSLIFVGAILFFNDFFEIETFDTVNIIFTASLFLIVCLIYPLYKILIKRLYDRITNKVKRKEMIK